MGHPLSRIQHIAKTPILLHDFPRPVMAQVEGVAVGAGWNIALACDLLVASTGARFVRFYVKLEVPVGWGGSWLLLRLVGLQQANRLTLSGESVSLEGAEWLGLVTWVRGTEDIGPFVDELTPRLAAARPSPCRRASC